MRIKDKVSILANSSPGLTRDEAILSANENGLRILSNMELDERLVKTDLWKRE